MPSHRASCCYATCNALMVRAKKICKAITYKERSD